MGRDGVGGGVSPPEEYWVIEIEDKFLKPKIAHVLHSSILATVTQASVFIAN